MYRIRLALSISIPYYGMERDRNIHIHQNTDRESDKDQIVCISYTPTVSAVNFSALTANKTIFLQINEVYLHLRLLGTLGPKITSFWIHVSIHRIRYSIHGKPCIF